MDEDLRGVREEHRDPAKGVKCFRTRWRWSLCEHWDPASPKTGVSISQHRAWNRAGVREVWAGGHTTGISNVHTPISDAETEVQRGE